MVLTLSFPSPYSELGLLPVISFFFCSVGPVLFAAYGLYEMCRFCKKRKDGSKTKEVEVHTEETELGEMLKADSV